MALVVEFKFLVKFSWLSRSQTAHFMILPVSWILSVHLSTVLNPVCTPVPGNQAALHCLEIRGAEPAVTRTHVSRHRRQRAAGLSYQRVSVLTWCQPWPVYERIIHSNHWHRERQLEYTWHVCNCDEWREEKVDTWPVDTLRPVCKYHDIAEKRVTETLFYICCINARDRLSQCRPTLPLSRHCHVSRNITRDILIDSHYTACTVYLVAEFIIQSLTQISIGRARLSQQTIIYLCNTSLQTPDRLQPTAASCSSQASRHS